mmetsp:Transcript_102210/g.284703  ORF Transcript_102210/g.284703 Transcript_102210/m.284703 type:complete len:103 (-) Transcript_102210:1039-1347(-)
MPLPSMSVCTYQPLPSLAPAALPALHWALLTDSGRGAFSLSKIWASHGSGKTFEAGRIQRFGLERPVLPSEEFCVNAVEKEFSVLNDWIARQEFIHNVIEDR